MPTSEILAIIHGLLRERRMLLLLMSRCTICKDNSTNYALYAHMRCCSTHSNSSAMSDPHAQSPLCSALYDMENCHHPRLQPLSLMK